VRLVRARRELFIEAIGDESAQRLLELLAPLARELSGEPPARAAARASTS
jgi:hypothetical protein